MAAMDPIIRLAQVSPVARRIGRPMASAAQQSIAAVAPVPDPLPLQAEPEPATEPASASAQDSVADIPPAIACACADELAQAERAHEAALAQRDAEIETLRKAAQQAAIDLTDAYSDAEQRGYEAGEKKGREAAGEAMREQIERIKSLAGEFSGAVRELTGTAEDVMVDIVFTAICRILGERGASRAAVQDVVRAAIAATREREQLVVRLHPDDVALLQDEADSGRLRISADSAVALGGCIVESPGGALDARFETQLEALAAALERVRASRLAEEDAA
jgi:flagellar biosynthesis/type III secretory pathway protein FliH